MHHQPQEKRRILLLQGHPSRFWAELGDALVEAGAAVRKVHFCLADLAFWGRRTGVSYRGGLDGWPDWLENYVAAEGITDIVYYADRFPYHVAARAVAEERGIRSWVIEHGYLRPDWITLEPGGMSAHSVFDRSPAALAETARTGDDPDMKQRFTHRFSTEATHEVAFGLLSVFGRPFYPRYDSDRRFWPILDYLSWLPKLAATPRANKKASAIENRLTTGSETYFLLPLQIESDYQLRDNSPYNTNAEFIDEVMASFASHAPPHARLLIKLHPLDSGLEMWSRRCRKLARDHGIASRIDIIRGGTLGRLIEHASGVVLVNSTVGLHALRQKKPVLARGEAIYDIPGLTHQGRMDQFWTHPEPVDPGQLSIFLRALATIQVKGSFYDSEGRRAAISTIVETLTGPAARSQRISLNRLRWRISNPAPSANSVDPSSSGKAIST